MAADALQHVPLPARTPAAPSLSGWAYRARVWEYLMRSFRPYVISTLGESIGAPVLYLLAMGWGLGTLVNRNGTDALGGVSYLRFIAPALLCAAALQIAMGEASYSTFSRFKWTRIWWGIIASPIRPAQIADAQLLFIATRLTITSTVYYLVLLVFHAAGGLLGLLMIPAAVLCAMACAALVVALSATMDDEGGSFNLLFRFGVIPMTLFSGSFFPITQLPWAVRWLAMISPLWHGNELARSAALARGSGWQIAGHLAYLLALLVIGIALSHRQFRRRLVV